MKDYPTPAMKRSWFTLTMLVSKDFKKKYRRSLLGVVWSVLNPLLMMIVLAAVFSSFIKFGDIKNFPLYLILGNTIFGLMNDSTRDGMQSILESTSLIKKVRIEKLIFPLEKVVFHLVNFCFSLVAVIMVMIFFRVMPTANVLFLPLLLIYVSMFSAGLSMLLSALAVFFRDILHRAVSDIRPDEFLKIIAGRQHYVDARLFFEPFYVLRRPAHRLVGHVYDIPHTAVICFLEIAAEQIERPCSQISRCKVYRHVFMHQSVSVYQFHFPDPSCIPRHQHFAISLSPMFFPCVSEYQLSGLVCSP